MIKNDTADDDFGDEFNWWQFIIWIIFPLMLYSYFIVPDAYNLLFHRNDKVIITEATIIGAQTISGKGNTRETEYNYVFSHQGKRYESYFQTWGRFINLSNGSQIKIYFPKDNPEDSSVFYQLILWALSGVVMIFVLIASGIKKQKIISRALRMKRHQGYL